MKKQLCVTIEVDVEIEIEDEALTPEELAIFSKVMFPVAAADDLFKYAAGIIALNEDHQEIEGLGYATSYKSGIDSTVKYNLLGLHLMADIDTEVEAE